ncbi:hypothetical protein PM3016_3618 [Paenibacillus mucilaginosus 3016]|uniref:PASTA domain-containing protein n=1 Tax=Paenibacillus mucilaginosus 3016 TaxID=1116391 RepID=H6NNR3_9BACL|nr:PASTA domain-containing protein [Paenibacillus mucilaginosus]AFC30439.1 hypothetical protein PM3016_3618 [Paenibacillus mucilaginosus 3016]WFA19073.1 PASTA domain-containing protein [Paenibacillus mucilaginosus]
MEKSRSIHSRYVLGRPILPMVSGMLYRGKDLALHREVILYVVESADDSVRQTAMAKLKEVAPLSDNRFLHMLDVGMEKPYLFAALKTFEGRPLIEALSRHPLSDREVLSGVFELGRGLQDAMEEGVQGFAVHAANVWLCDDGRLKIINYWDKAHDRERGVQGLARLLLQLLTRSEEPELGPQGERQLRAALASLNAVQQAELIAMLRRTAARQETLSSLVVHLGLLVKSPEAPSSKIASSIDEDEDFEAPDATMRFERPIRREPAGRYAPPASSQVPADEEEEEEEERPRAWKTGLKLLLGAALVCTAGAAVFVWLVNEAPPLPGMPSKQEASAQPPAADETEEGGGTQVSTAPQAGASSGTGTAKTPETAKVPPVTSAEKPAEEVPAEEETVTEEEPAVPATEGGPIETPNLIGLQQSEAEAKAKESGLGYAFYKKASEEPAGTVYDQMPKPGEAAPQGTKVIFYVSRGPGSP